MASHSFLGQHWQHVAGDAPPSRENFRGFWPSEEEALGLVASAGLLVEDREGYWSLWRFVGPLDVPQRRRRKRRDWNALSEQRQRRYLRSRQLRELASAAFPQMRVDDAVRAWYEAGLPLQAGRGMVGTAEHRGRKPGMSKERYRALLAAASSPTALYGGLPPDTYALFIGPSMRDKRRKRTRSDSVRNARRRERYRQKRLAAGKTYTPRA